MVTVMVKRWTLRLLAAFFSIIVIFLLSAWIGSMIPRNADWKQPDSGIDIMVETNGVHTAIIVPLVTAQKDWRPDFPVSEIDDRDRPYTHLSISWGERDVFLNTPTWSDLSPLTVLRIIALGGDGLLHVSHYVQPRPGKYIRGFRISADEYRLLVQQIEASMPRRDTRKRYHGYTTHDVFYDAPFRYTVFNTCNQWTSNTLAAAGIRTGYWTPFAGGVMHSLPGDPQPR